MKTAEENAEPLEDLAGIRKSPQTPKEIGTNKRAIISIESLEAHQSTNKA